MPGDTKIVRAPNRQGGWIDIDVPRTIYATRLQARNGRASRLLAAKNSRSLHPSGGIAPQRSTGAIPVADADTDVKTVTTDNPGVFSLTSLQFRLFLRLTQEQGVSPDDALSVMRSFGYNASASYGHLRAAGATHDEALSVIHYGVPAVSRSYGEARVAGKGHFEAAQEAIISHAQGNVGGDG